MVTRRGREEKIERGILLSFSSRLNTQTLLALTVSETPRLPPFYHTRRMYGYRLGLGETCMYTYILYLRRFNRPEKDQKLLYNPFSVLPLLSRCVLHPPATNSRLQYYVEKKQSYNSIVFYSHTQNWWNYCS